MALNHRSMSWVLAATAIAALSVAGCSTSKKAEPAKLQSFKATLPASIAWAADVGKSPKVDIGVGQFSPAISGDFVYAASPKSVTRVSITTGQVSWKRELDATIVAGVAVGSGESAGLSAVVTDRGELVLIGADGAIVRRFSLGGVAQEVPVLIGNIAVVRLTDNRVGGWDVQTGIRRWVTQRNLPNLVLHAQSGLLSKPSAPEEFASTAVGANDVVANLPGGRILWINALTGGLRWESQVATPKGTNEVERIVDLLGAPSSEGKDVCVSAYQSVVACYNGETGKRLWTRDVAAVTPVAMDARFVYVADTQSRLFAYTRATGSPAWSVETLQLRGLTAPLSWGRALWLSDRFGYLHGLSREDGSTIARLDLGSQASGAMRATNKGLVVQTQAGRLMLIRTEG
jgi:outer membrane protein assembly factor BamB